MKQIHLLGLPCFGMVSANDGIFRKFKEALSGSPMLIDVCYDGVNQILFKANETNYHELYALSLFVKQKQESATIKVPHVLGGDFVAKFEILNSTTIKYTNATLQDVFFLIPFNTILNE
jgi:hypothetical protein